ncbi:hypothetical protein TheveDRAFT_1246 [Thermanaerovibrio velox DSM 12556]|uniref:Uncharacterized protein n=1 Tax=Thermanaerovibrio velox DSM 12556 TaxID=926567 RepID=H0UN82_9BACT|nr:hypothetical protein TheveDRAFT_1246 [Thermanaerovibrio velox DSM 12556]
MTSLGLGDELDEQNIYHMDFRGWSSERYRWAYDGAVVRTEWSGFDG